jgi:hypothetical protein
MGKLAGFSKLAVAALLAVSILAITVWLSAPALAQGPAAASKPGTVQDRLLTDSMGVIKTNIDRTGQLVAKGDFKGIKTVLKTIQGNWGPVQAELQFRGENAAAASFSASLQALNQAADKSDKAGLSAAAKQLNSGFASVMTALGNVSVDVSRLFAAGAVLVLGWAFLALVIVRIIKVRKIKQ